jgi:hypothetical protein
MSKNDPLLLPREAGEQLRKHAVTIRTMCAAKEIRHIVEYGPTGQPRYKIPQSAIDEYLQRHMVARRA